MDLRDYNCMLNKPEHWALKLEKVDCRTETVINQLYLTRCCDNTALFYIQLALLFEKILFLKLVQKISIDEIIIAIRIYLYERNDCEIIYVYIPTRINYSFCLCMFQKVQENWKAVPINNILLDFLKWNSAVDCFHNGHLMFVSLIAVVSKANTACSLRFRSQIQIQYSAFFSCTVLLGVVFTTSDE